MPKKSTHSLDFRRRHSVVFSVTCPRRISFEYGTILWRNENGVGLPETFLSSEPFCKHCTSFVRGKFRGAFPERVIPAGESNDERVEGRKERPLC
ncbi:hypothetical protein CDAR_79721 [Caerostris darwini]|uniref:Uncharacterized protein n=1 Tax=Caerostris darwini TaxID=1538125 RepID=A0AAV4VAL8_9ARAC|nr:hypothetical protein CDAR_79721 [Caerostris darwini]